MFQVMWFTVPLINVLYVTSGHLIGCVTLEAVSTAWSPNRPDTNLEMNKIQDVLKRWNCAEVQSFFRLKYGEALLLHLPLY